MNTPGARPGAPENVSPVAHDFYAPNSARAPELSQPGQTTPLARKQLMARPAKPA